MFVWYNKMLEQSDVKGKIENDVNRTVMPLSKRRWLL